MRLDDGTPVCWGRNLGYNQIDIPEAYQSQEFSTIDAGCYHTCALRADDGKVNCWGSDIKGGYDSSTGNAYTVDSESGQATPPNPDQAYKSIACCSHYTCALTEPEGAIECWCAPRPTRASQT